MTLSRKNEPIIVSATQKKTDIHQMFESMRLYMTMVQPSSVIIWKIVSRAHAKLSKHIMPKRISG